MKNKKGFQKNVHSWNYGEHLSEQHRLHISQGMKGRAKPWLRKPLTKEHIDNISKSLKGVKKPLEQRRKMSENHNPISDNNLRMHCHDRNWLGRKHTEESKIKMRLSHNPKSNLNLIGWYNKRKK